MKADTHGYEMLLAKLEDGVKISRSRPYFIGFLNEKETFYLENKIDKSKGNYISWGGHKEAERKLLGIFPDFISPDTALFPVCQITVTYRRQDVLSHRDFLGAFMSLGIHRSVLGDFLIEDGRAVIFVKREICDYFLSNIVKIGSVGVNVEGGAQFPLPRLHDFLDISCIVSSNRLDCMVAALIRVSREKSAQAIISGMVEVNHSTIIAPSSKIKEGDLISVRKFGRFVIDTFGSLTRKGRLSVKCRKYI